MDETPAQQPGPAPGAHPGPTTDPPPGPPPGASGQGGYAPPSSGADAFFDNVRRMGVVRSDDRWVGGVAGGLAQRLGIDPLIVRGLFGVGALLGGVGLVLYGIGWLLLPEQRDGRIHLQQLFRGDFDAAVIGGFAAILVGFGATDAWGMPWWGDRHSWWGGALGLLAIVVVVVVLVSNASRSRGAGPSTSLPHTPPPYGPAPFGPVPPTPAAAGRPPEGGSMSAAPASFPGPDPQAHGPGRPGQGPADTGYGRPPCTPPPPVPSGPQTPLPPVRSGPGGRPVGIVVALSLIVLAGLLYAERIGRFDGPVLLTAAAVMVIVSGLAISIAGVLGRTSGGLGGLAIVTLLVAVPIGAASDVDRSGATFVGAGVHRPTETSVAEEGYRVVAGNVVIDLTDLPLGDDVVIVPVRLGAGELTVVVPEEGAYTARVRQVAGDFTWLDDPATSGVGDSGWRTYSSDAVHDGAEPQLELELSLMAGRLTVEEGR